MRKERALDRRVVGIVEQEKNSHVVMKFGGYCMATADNIRKSADIVLRDPRRVIAVVSAPGARPEKKGDPKITRLLEGLDPRKNTFTEEFGLIEERYMGIATDLFENNQADIVQVQNWIGDVRSGIIERASDDRWAATEWAGSRGEWLMGRIFHRYLEKRARDRNIATVDPADYIKMKVSENKLEREILPQTYRNINDYTDTSKAEITVVPGYYGSDENGNIVTLTRGGSDYTATIFGIGSNAVQVEMYKDVPGVLAADPNIVPDARQISHMTVDEITEQTAGGAGILQSAATRPLREIEEEKPIFIRGLSDPTAEGTLVTKERDMNDSELVTAIAHKGDTVGSEFLAIQVEKSGIEATPSVIRRVIEILGPEVSLDHLPTRGKSFTIFVPQNQLNGRLAEVKQSIETKINPDRLQIYEDLGLVSVVGDGIRRRPTDALATVFTSLTRREIPVETVIYEPGSNNILFAVHRDRVGDAVNTVYDATIRQAA